MGLTYDFDKGCWLRGGEQVSTVVLLSEGFGLSDLVGYVDSCLSKKERVLGVGIMARDKGSDWSSVVRGIRSSDDVKEEYRDLVSKIRFEKKKKNKRGSVKEE